MSNSLRGRLVEKAAQWMPGKPAAMLDRLRPALAEGFGGPFNGQERRTEAVREIFEQIRFGCVIETGTYRATTTLFLGRLVDLPVATVELNPRYFHYSRRRLRGASNVTLIRGDSATVLTSLAKSPPWSRGPAFFYLDAHWDKHLPLAAELESIMTGWQDFAILVDDFRVPGDPGYAYDDYGPGKSLELAFLAPFAARPAVVYWPAASSVQETGARRGWIVVASAGRVDEALLPLTSLRRAGALSTLGGAPEEVPREAQ